MTHCAKQNGFKGLIINGEKQQLEEIAFIGSPMKFFRQWHGIAHQKTSALAC